MTEVVKVLHTECHYTCGDGCCDFFDVTSEFMYKDQVYQFESRSCEENNDRFLKEVLGIVFEEEEVVYENLSD